MARHLLNFRSQWSAVSPPARRDGRRSGPDRYRGVIMKGTAAFHVGPVSVQDAATARTDDVRNGTSNIHGALKRTYPAIGHHHPDIASVAA